MKIWAYGDSFVAGDQDIPNRVDAVEENMEYNRYNISFASHLAKSVNRKLINRAISGCSNYVQLDKLFLDAHKIDKNDIVLFGITTTWRDRFTLQNICPEVLSKTRGPTMLHRELVYDYELTKIPTIDLFYVLSAIEKIEKIFEIKVVKFNLFHDIISEASEEDKKLFKFDNYIGLDVEGNTLIDLLIENWGNPQKRIVDHSKWKPSNKYGHLFTSKSHPNVEGHKIIAIWLEKELKKLNLL